MLQQQTAQPPTYEVSACWAGDLTAYLPTEERQKAVFQTSSSPTAPSNQPCTRRMRARPSAPGLAQNQAEQSQAMTDSLISQRPAQNVSAFRRPEGTTSNAAFEPVLRHPNEMQPTLRRVEGIPALRSDNQPQRAQSLSIQHPARTQSGDEEVGELTGYTLGTFHPSRHRVIGSSVASYSREAALSVALLRTRACSHATYLDGRRWLPQFCRCRIRYVI
jgi:hypothetical protein